jgi:hypothetical protein
MRKWSRHSRRMEPMSRSANGFCQGARGGEDLADVHALDSSRERLAIDRVSITEQEPGNRIVPERRDDLSGGPGGRGVIRDVEVEELAALMVKHHEDEQETEGQGWHEGSDQEMQWRGEERLVQVSPKLAGRTQWVQIPTGEGLATPPEPSLATSRVTGAWMRRQGVHGPVCASPENQTTVAAAETVLVVEGNTQPSAQARTAGAVGVYGVGTRTRVRLQPGRPLASRMVTNRCG